MNSTSAVCCASLLLACLLVGCGSSDSLLIGLAQTSVKGQLKDPESAKFGQITLLTPEQQSVKFKSIRVACGSVNAKNSYGGYTGALRFTVFLGIRDGSSKHESIDVRIEPTPGDEIFKDAVWNYDCKDVTT